MSGSNSSGDSLIVLSGDRPRLPPRRSLPILGLGGAVIAHGVAVATLALAFRATPPQPPQIFEVTFMQVSPGPAIAAMRTETADPTPEFESAFLPEPKPLSEPPPELPTQESVTAQTSIEPIKARQPPQRRRSASPLPPRDVDTHTPLPAMASDPNALGMIGAAPSLPTAPTTNQTHASPHGIASTYANTLTDWIYRHRYYPRAARLRRHEGTVHIAMTLHRSGRMETVTIHRSSGYNTLDDAALDMARRASPMPPPGFTPDIERAIFIVPIDFSMPD